ncbi:MAG: CHASE2 domain-containing protein, partial [Burkholderiales bacterium]|nr:CHASE2 domain-containing protein [Burkholderiales bacterium]
MTGSSFWKSDWFIGLAIGVLFVLLSGSELLQGLERKAYDLGVRFSSAQPSDQVAVIAIDDQSIASLGRWPWSRDVHARLTDILAQSGARVIGQTVFFTEPQFDPARNASHANIQALGERLASPVLKALPAPAAEEIEAIQALVASTEAAMNTDRVLAASVRGAGNVMLGMLFQQFDREPIGNPDGALPDYVVRNTVAAAGNAIDVTDLPLSGRIPIVPFAEVGTGAAGIGHLNNPLDIDGAVRSDALVVRHYDQYFPSMALLLAARSLNLAPRDIQVEYGNGLRLGKLSIRTDPRMLMQTFWYRGAEGRPAFAPDSFQDVLNGRVPASKYRDKIVIIGPTAAGIGATLVTPIATDMPGVMALAHSVSSILEAHFFVTPWWAAWARWGLVLLVVLYLA